MKKFLLSLLSLVCVAVYAQDLRFATEQVEDASALAALESGDAIVLKCVDSRIPFYAFNPGTTFKDETLSAENVMVISNAVWHADTKTLSCYLQQKSSGKYLSQTIGTLVDNLDGAFEFNILMREPTGVDDAIETLDVTKTVSVTDGGSNFLNSQGNAAETPVGWRNGTAAWSVWYLYKVTNIFTTLKDGGQYYIKTQGSAYSGNNDDFYYSCSDDDSYNIILRNEADSDYEIWEASIPEDAEVSGLVQLRNLGTDLWLHTNPNNDDPYGRKQVRPEEGNILLVNPTVEGLRNNDASLVMLWSNRSGATLLENFDKSAGDRFLVYSLTQSADGTQIGAGMYYSGEANDGKYGLVYRLYDVETGYAVALPEEPEVILSAYDTYVAYIQSITIPEIGSFREGTDPGCVKNFERVKEVITRLTELRDILDEDVDPDDAELWRNYLAEAKALVEEMENFEFYPVVPGYYRVVNAFSGFMDQQGVEKALTAANEVDGNGNVLNAVAAWFDLDPGTPITDEEGNETGEISGKNQVWQVYEEDGKLYMKNFGRQNYFTNANTQSGNVYMGEEPQWVEFRSTGGGDFNLFVGGKGYALHCGGHSSGAGKSGFIVGWNGGTGGCSAWFMRPISEEEIKDIWGETAIDDVMLDSKLANLIAQVQKTLAASKVVEVEINMDTKLITSVDQISSEGSEETEGSLEALIDGDNSTYWHSCWSGGSLEFGSEEQMKHYLQFDLGQAYERVAMTYVCRPVANDKPSSFSVTACNTADGEFVEVATVENVGNVNNTVYKFAIELGGAYRYIRLRATDTHTGKRGYWHASEMQFYSDFATSPNLFEKTGDVGVALEEALAAALEVRHATKDDIDALQAAYDAFLAVYTDPTAILAAIARGEYLVSVGGVGTGVGQKNSQTTFSALEAALEAAKKFRMEQLATCTKAELDAKCQALVDAIAAWEAIEPIKLSTGVWYYLQCPDQPFQNIGYNPVEGSYFAEGTSLRGSRVAIGNGDAEDAQEGESYMHMVPVENRTATSAVIGGEEREYSYTDECAQWRFIAASDSTYYMQNRATGLFMPTFTTSSGMQATSYIPGAFKPAYYPGGIVNLVGTYDEVNDKGEVTVKETCLHMQVANAVLVAWPTRATTAINNGSSWEIVKAEDVAAGYEQNINIALDSMIVRGLTLPYAIDASSVEGEVRFFTEVVGIDETNKAVCCNESHDLIPAGKPMFVYCSESEEGIQYGKVKMADTKFSWTVDNSGAIAGTLKHGTTVPARTGIPTMCYDENSFMGVCWGAFATCGDVTKVAIGSAWLRGIEELKGHNAEDCDCDETFVLITTKGGLTDEITTVKDNNVITGAVYNLNGQRVNAPVKGLYILNGKKIVIR